MSNEDALIPGPADTLAAWVRERRRAAGYATQGALAEAMSAHAEDVERVVPTNYVWQLENGRIRRRPGETTRALALEYGISRTTVANIRKRGDVLS